MCAPALDDYRAIVNRLIGDPPQLAALRARLADPTVTGALFDAQAYCRNLEKAFTAVVDRYRSGMPAADIVV